jgi:adenosine deaminase
MMVQDFGFGLEDLRGFMLNGLAAAWIDDSTRRAWRSESLAQFDALRPLWPTSISSVDQGVRPCSIAFRA